MTTEVNNVTSSTVARSRDPDQLDPRLVVDAIVRYVFPVVVIVGIANLYSLKIHGRYRQDTDMYKRRNTHTHAHPFNGPFSGTTRVGQYQKGKTNLDFTEARDSE